ncbi:MAG: cysteine desulfurase family protein [Azospirillaceae bacterium]|nr:cysteine desulfurase family protein [Azospirillaceae bacterium]
MAIYFDHSATTPVDPRVVEAMTPFQSDVFANPSSLHQAGRRARQAVDAARAQVAALLNARPAEIIFTASGTEADNLALIGAMATAPAGLNHLITSAFEHPAILETCQWLERHGTEVTRLPVDGDGLVAPEALRRSLRPTTRLVSIMAANNVVGTVQPIAELAAVTRAAGALFHTDAVQAVGKLPLDLAVLPVDLLSLSAHKLHGPKGVGALFVRDGVAVAPLIHGGGQERGLRSATENVAGIVGLGRATVLAAAERAEEASRLVGLRDTLLDGITAACPGAYLIGHRFRRLPGHLSVGFAGQEGEAIKLLLALDEAGFAVSTGSACSAAHAAEPSYVLQAMGFDPFRARGALRITLGRFTTGEEIARFIEVLPPIVASLRGITSPRRARR